MFFSLAGPYTLSTPRHEFKLVKTPLVGLYRSTFIFTERVDSNLELPAYNSVDFSSFSAFKRSVMSKRVNFAEYFAYK